KAVEFRKGRRFARAEISPKDAALLDHRVGLLFDVGAEVAGVGLGRRLQALAGDVEQPAVKGAAQAAILESPVREIGAAVRAVPADQAIAAFVVLEGDEVLAQKPQRLDGPVAGKLVNERRWLPIAPQQPARRG